MVCAIFCSVSDSLYHIIFCSVAAIVIRKQKKRSSNEESLENKRSKELTDLDDIQEKTATTNREGVESMEEANQMIERVKSRDDLYLI